ncbi:ATP/GTP-binding protein [Arthrobacter sp. MMS18-M83]|uniref:ATP/GTP-binding protein n=1 Tax=Arthrobacter sp. MMS18-M83 TaxID=2996261 RepID=UPI00227A59AB|nr:ATP/GTP-binding protein [Arthrobacter sp. MMS18-M83]WAH99752.1 ATP/GTP-binding protein [Arthrobacter sp. MMS18-M83]
MIDTTLEPNPAATEPDPARGQDPTKAPGWVQKTRSKFAAPDATIAAADADPNEWLPWISRGSLLRKSDSKAAKGFYAPALPGSPTSTKQAEILNTTLIAAPTGASGVSQGRDVMSRTGVNSDPITGYNSTPKIVTSTGVIVLGDVGSAKSSLVKCNYVIRPLILKDRRAVIFDKKDQAGEGEYSELCRHYGHDPLRFTMDESSTRWNLVDPGLSSRNDDGGDNHLELLYTIPSLVRSGVIADEWERKTIRLAYRSLLKAFEGGRKPTLDDFVRRLGFIDVHEPSLVGMSGAAVERLHQAGLSIRWVFDDLLDSYGTVFDGETSKEVKLDGKITSFDISQLPDAGPCIPTVMGVANLWLLATARRERGWKTNVITEEAWYIMGTELAKQARSNQKLARGLGFSNIFVMHKGSDVPVGSPGMAVIQEAHTIHVYRQNRPEEAKWCQETFGFQRETAPIIENLDNGHHIFKVGAGNPETEVQHIRSEWEKKMTDTDTALSTEEGAR